MANPTTGYGLWPILPPNEAMALAVYRPVDSSNGTAIGINEAVVVEGDGNIGVAGVSDPIYGTALAMFDSDHIPVYSYGRNRLLPASTAGYVSVLPAFEGALYRIRANADATLTSAAVGTRYDTIVGTPSTSTGYSARLLDSDNSGALQIRLVKLIDWEPTSSVDSTLASNEFICQIAERQTASV